MRGTLARCVCACLGCLGLTSLPWGGSFQKRMSSRQKGERKYEKAERGFGIWSFVFIKKKEEINSKCFRKKRAGKEGFSDSTPKGPTRAGWKSPKIRP